MSERDKRVSAQRVSASGRHMSVENQLAHLGKIIQPTGRHRDRTLQRVSEAGNDYRGKVRSAQFAVGISIAMMIISPIIGALTRIDAPPPQTTHQANEQALSYAQQQGTSLDWGLVDVFKQFRANKRPESKPTQK